MIEKKLNMSIKINYRSAS